MTDGYYCGATGLPCIFCNPCCSNRKFNTPEHELSKRIESLGGREAVRLAYELADLILFHAKVRENTKHMLETWEM